jgi:uncharacterized membrane protein YfcA
MYASGADLIMFGLPPSSVALLALSAFVIATVVNTFAMEAAVLFTPSFLYLFPFMIEGFPEVGVNGAIGLAIFVELFGYSSSVTAYWFRKQVDFHIALKLLVLTVPLAIAARVGAYLVPSTLLMVSFGGLLLLLSVVLYESHEHAPSFLEQLLEMPVTPLTLNDLNRISGEDVPDDYKPRTRFLANPGHEDGGSRDGFHLELFDYLITGVGGTLAGLLGIAIGELTQTMLTVRKNISIQLSTGTSAFVLHLTIVSALVTNIVLLLYAPHLAGEEFTVPFKIGSIAAVGCLFGGQAGAYLNNRLSEATIMNMLITAYALVGGFVIYRTLFW